jgi:hypothetical protein
MRGYFFRTRKSLQGKSNILGCLAISNLLCSSAAHIAERSCSVPLHKIIPASSCFHYAGFSSIDVLFEAIFDHPTMS